MQPSPADALNDRVRQTLLGYDETLLRKVVHKLCRPRNQWPAAELVERAFAALENAAVLDRRLKDLPDASRQLLGLLAHGRQPRWPVGSLVELLAALGHGDPLAAVSALLDAGLMFPELPPPATNGSAPHRGRLKNFETWLARSEPPPVLFVPPLVLGRCLDADLGLPACPGAVALPGAVPQEADGLEWPLRLAVLWQQLHATPLRRTQQQDFFKRDLDRLRADPLLSPSPADALTAVPDSGLFGVALGLASGLLVEEEGELRADDFSATWQRPLPELLAELWAALPWVRGWGPGQGWRPDPAAGQPFASAQLLALMLLAGLAEDEWASPAALDEWTRKHHPYWGERDKGPVGIAAFLLGIAYPLRLLQAAKNPRGEWLVRLSPLGRWVLRLSEVPPTAPAFPQTLLVQPTLEILAYRQGLTPSLVVTLGRCATWKGLSPACTLQLEPASVYRALETGETLPGLVQTLERHGMKAIPPAVLDSLRTWADKRERLTIFTSAALFEFGSPAEMADALARGLPAVRLTDRLAAVANEKEIDYRHFRLTGTRDYCLPPERCVDAEADGVTMSIDLAKSDLLLDTELQRFAEPAPRQAPPGRKLYRLTPATVAAARDRGVTLSYLEQWFERRTGQRIPAAARLLFAGPDAAPLELRRELVLHVGSAEVADGLQEWPGTRALVRTRLGPTAIGVAEEDVPDLLERLAELGVRLEKME